MLSCYAPAQYFGSHTFDSTTKREALVKIIKFAFKCSEYVKGSVSLKTYYSINELLPVFTNKLLKTRQQE
jgi:hypothetical protein